ncbi:unannotated protein [freshwater metagenome]|uniref:Unannotated protein n=1 Tax=freshwater metagenome TaxID=449393 RepID=A0A6J6PD55_9ZZZZ
MSLEPVEQSPTSFAGAVLVGGRSSRMGSDKALVPVHGVPMALRVLDCLRAAGAAPVFSVGGTDRGLKVPHREDDQPDQGPLGGLLSALVHARGIGSERLVAVACDLAFLDPETVLRLVVSLEGFDVAFARTERRQPLCAAWRVGPAHHSLALAFGGGERAVHRAVGQLRVIDVDVDATSVVNINTPADVATAMFPDAGGAGPAGVN